MLLQLSRVRELLQPRVVRCRGRLWHYWRRRQRFWRQDVQAR
jgi:hypothetical protein